MPIPAPKPSEARQSYMQRCMSDQTMVDEYREAPQRWAVCQTQWESGRKELTWTTDQDPKVHEGHCGSPV